MEWIRISTNKLKIMLTAEDARRYALNCAEANGAVPLAHAAFREILHDVKERTGFDTTDDKIYIQMYPSKEGGCELFITKTGLLLTEPQPPATQNETEKKETPVRRPPRRARAAFLFEEFGILLLLCRRLKKANFPAESEVWRDEKGQWWLLLSLPTEGKFFPDLSFIREYAKERNHESARLYLPEHASPICLKKAVETLGEL